MILVGHNIQAFMLGMSRKEIHSVWQRQSDNERWSQLLKSKVEVISWRRNDEELILKKKNRDYFIMAFLSEGWTWTD